MAKIVGDDELVENRSGMDAEEVPEGQEDKDLEGDNDAASVDLEAVSHIIRVSILHFKVHTTYCLRLLMATGAYFHIPI